MISRNPLTRVNSTILFLVLVAQATPLAFRNKYRMSCDRASSTPVVRLCLAVVSINAEDGPSFMINDTEVPTIIHAINDDGTLVEVEDVVMVF